MRQIKHSDRKSYRITVKYIVFSCLSTTTDKIIHCKCLEDSFLTDTDYLTLESDQSNNACNNSKYINIVSTYGLKNMFYMYSIYFNSDQFHHNLETYIYIEKYCDGRQLFNGWIGTLHKQWFIITFLYHVGVFLL